MYGTSQKLIAEFLGTFALIFFGAGSICTDQYLHGAGGGLGLLGIALAHGLAIAIMVSALGHISGGHFNPAVTVGIWVTKRIGTIEAFLYWLAQLAGATAAAFLLKSVVPEETWRAVALGAPELARDFPVWAGMALDGRKGCIPLNRGIWHRPLDYPGHYCCRSFYRSGAEPRAGLRPSACRDSLGAPRRLLGRSAGGRIYRRLALRFALSEEGLSPLFD